MIRDCRPFEPRPLASMSSSRKPSCQWCSSASTTCRTLTDPRKDLAATALNLGTGVKVSDVDLEKARDLLARDYLAEQLRGQQGVGRSESYYLRPGALDELTPEQVALLRLEKNLDARNKAKGKVGVQAR